MKEITRNKKAVIGTVILLMIMLVGFSFAAISSVQESEVAHNAKPVDDVEHPQQVMDAADDNSFGYNLLDDEEGFGYDLKEKWK